MPGSLCIGRENITLAAFGELLAGRCQGRVLYFGSCETLKVPQPELEDFQEATRARAVCGYTANVDWLEAAAFELRLIDAVSRYKRVNAPFNWLEKSYGDLTRKLQLRYVW